MTQPQLDYDYIIVGAGSAGSVLANRLSADAAIRVLVLEAGPPDRKREIPIPIAWAKLFKSEVDWNYGTTPQAHLQGRTIYWPRGKTLGGSSSTNAQVYLRGHPDDFDEWARLGNPGWSYAEVLPYFKKSENNERGPDEFHGGAGPLHIGDLRDPHPLTATYLQAAAEAGLPRNPDCNGREQDGLGYVQVTQRKGRRWSCADAFLRPVRQRRNLTVWTNVHAQRILFQGKRATGLAGTRDGRAFLVNASREIVLCAGAVNSPQLLLLSGIGPARDLRDQGIEVVHELPGVGLNLQDHLLIMVLYRVRGVPSLLRAGSWGNLFRYLFRKRGWLTSNVMEAAGFARSAPELTAPDLELGFGPVLFQNQGLTAPTEHGCSLGAILLKPCSTGSIRLQSRDHLAAPAIDPRYLSDESGQDLRTLVAGVRLCRAIAGAPAFGPYRDGEIAPGDQCQTDGDIEHFLRSQAQTIYHPVGTCKMGVDALAVVDPALRVHGLAGLRVADASVMPTNVRGHTNAAAIMIAEKAAEMIVASWVA